MEKEIQKTLQLAIEAHRNNKVEEAENYYHTILKSNSTHADANHNLGVLFLSLSQTRKAIRHLKTALENDRSVDQFWITYLKSLVRFCLLIEAKATLKEARKLNHNFGFISKFERLLFNFKEHNYETPNDLQYNELKHLLELFEKFQLRGQNKLMVR